MLLCEPQEPWLEKFPSHEPPGPEANLLATEFQVPEIPRSPGLFRWLEKSCSYQPLHSAPTLWPKNVSYHKPLEVLSYV